MNSNHKKTYISPTSETLELKPQGMLCVSTQDGSISGSLNGYKNEDKVWY